MRTIFVDTFYWVALINPQDTWYQPVITISASLRDVQLITTEEILTEVLTFYAESGSRMRQRVISFIDSIINNRQIQVVAQSHASFSAGLLLYRSRLDKGYSLTDCISMNTMRELELTEVLTHDHHFTQEGFIILFK